MCPSWYGELGQFITTKFFGMKINKYMHDHGISHETLAKVAAKNYRNGSRNENVFRRKPLSEEEILASPYLNYPLTQYMFCSPDEGAAAVVLCKAENAHRYTNTPIYLRASTVRTRRLGVFEVHSPWLPMEETVGPTVDVSRAAYETVGIGPSDVDVIQLQDTDAGAEVIHLAENGFCADGEQERLVADGVLEIGGSLPVNTDGGLIVRTASRSARRACAKCTKSCANCAVKPATVRCPVIRRSDTRSSTARPEPPASRSCRPDVDTRDTPEQAELRRSARQLARTRADDRGRSRR